MATITTTASIVIDSCVWIDLANGNVLEEAFCLPFKLIDADVMQQEQIHPTNWPKLQKLGLILMQASAHQIFDIVTIKNENRGLSFYDASALELAIRENCRLLTDDRYLIKIAGKYQVDVCGVTWLLNEMVHQSCLTGSAALAALKRIDGSGHAISSHDLKFWTEHWSK
jgi:predicted nucleic acid-binding protein